MELEASRRGQIEPLLPCTRKGVEETALVCKAAKETHRAWDAAVLTWPWGKSSKDPMVSLCLCRANGLTLTSFTGLSFDRSLELRRDGWRFAREISLGHAKREENSL